MIRIKNGRAIQKQNKGTFIAFENERDNLGRIIKPKIQKKSDYDIMRLFENLKKSTKQYFFDKEFEKMYKKFQFLKRSLEQDRERDYDKQVDACIDIVDKMLQRKAQQEKDKQNLYINLRQNIKNKINGVSLGLNRLRSNKKSQKSTKNTFFSQKDQEFLKQQVRNPKQGSINKKYRWQPTKTSPSGFKTQCQSQSQSNYILQQIQHNPKSINIELFKSLSSRSEMMATFCDSGLKYSKLVEGKRFHPWKKWYRKSQLEIFPGKLVQLNSLQKSIYQ